MKTRYLFLTLAGAAALALSSCSLDEDLSVISTPDNFFRKPMECESVVNSCYINIKSIYNYTYLIATECCTDLAYCPSGTLDARLDISPAIPRFGQTVWNNGYTGVARCNFAIKGIENSKTAFVTSEGEIDEKNEMRLRLLGEAKVLRAFYYYTLTSFFGDVPFYFDDVEDLETLDRIGQLGRMSAVETRKACIEDLEGIAPLLPQTRTSENDGQRLGAAVAWTLIAKMSLWNATKDVPANSEMWYRKALEALKKVEAIYGDFTQYDLETNMLWRNKNTPESIMEIQHSYTQGGLEYTSNAAAICQPYPHTANSAIFDGVEVDILGSDATAWAAMRPNMYFCQGLQTKLGPDLRKNLNMAWAYNGREFKSVSGRPWMGPKFWCPHMYQTKDGNNYPVFRYADTILMIAECYNELNEDDKAVEYLNMTRRRAGLKDYVFRTHVRLQDEIRSERGRELIGEFQRKFDLVRWGIWYEATLGNNDYQALKDNILPCHEYYPIPDQEVVKSKGNLDNKAYAKYGL